MISTIPDRTPPIPTLNSTRGNQQATLFWDSVSYIGSPITDYIINMKNGTIWNTINDGISTNTNYTIGNLTNGVSYDFKINTVNSIGNSSSNIISVIPATIPNSPTQLIIVNGITDIDLHWTKPINNGGSIITDYKIEYSSNNGNSWTVYNDGVSITTNSKVIGLLQSNQYSFRVSAINQIGSSIPIISDGNILEFEKYRITSGNPIVYSNSTGIYLSGTGELFLKLKFNGNPSNQTTSVLFNNIISSGGTLQFLNDSKFDPVDKLDYTTMCILPSDITWTNVSTTYPAFTTYAVIFTGVTIDNIPITLSTGYYYNGNANADPPNISDLSTIKESNLVSIL